MVERASTRPRAGFALRGALLALGLVLSGVPAGALDSFEFLTPGADRDLRDRLRSASTLVAARQSDRTGAQDLYSAARADYARLLSALYADGRYSGIISITIDGREAADIPPLDAPDTISAIRVRVDPGPRFRFSAARMRPYAPGTDLPPDYGDGKVAFSGSIVAAAREGVTGWRNVGHPKAAVGAQEIVAEHADHTLSSLILLDPGPKLRFGNLRLTGYERLRPERLARIAGFPTGSVFSPAEVRKVEDRLRRTEIFRAFALVEDEVPNPDGTLDYALTVTEAPLRRIGFGAGYATTEGFNVGGYWLHRNLFGGGERLRIEGAATNIGVSSMSADFSFGLRLDRPAILSPDTHGYLEFAAEILNEPDYELRTASVGAGLTHVFTDTLSGEAGFRFAESSVSDATGDFRFRQIALPVALTIDRRDRELNATRGFYLGVEATPYYGLLAAESGARLYADLRGYRELGARDIVLAGRLQAGTILGSSIEATPRDYLFYSGGGGTVRGQPYQSLGANVIGGGTITTGGMSFVGLSAEARVPFSRRISGVAFLDAGWVSAETLFGGDSDWHSGAGLGVRYDTPIGPLRVDVAAPVYGSTGDGVQLYIGVGQAF